LPFFLFAVFCHVQPPSALEGSTRRAVCTP
jgi:hypothetical protein